MRLLSLSLLVTSMAFTTIGAAPAAKPTPTPKPTLIKHIPSQLISTNSADQLVIPLTTYFRVPSTTNDLSSIVYVTTTFGGFMMQLFPSNAPATVANFIRYMNAGAYESTLIHKRVNSPNVIETGGYTLDSTLSSIPTWDPITNESSNTNDIPNTVGTVAMIPELLTNITKIVTNNMTNSVTNSTTNITSEWLINLADNSSLLAPGNTNGNQVCPVFAQVLGDGLNTVLSPIASLTALNLQASESNAVFSPFYSIPLVAISNLTQNYPITYANFVAINHVMTLPYFAYSSDADAFSTQIQGTNLIVKFQAYGSSNVTITAYAADTNGNFVKSTFGVAPTVKGSQTITFPSVTNQYTRDPYTFNGYTNYPTSSSGMPVYPRYKSGPARVANGYLYFTGLGTITLIGTQPGNNNYNAASNAVGTITVIPADQTITFPTIPDVSNAVIPLSFNLTNYPTASSALPVSVAVGSGSATLKGKKLSVSGTGTITLIATQLGNKNYLPAPPFTNSFTVSTNVPSTP